MFEEVNQKLIQLAKDVWGTPEFGFREFKSSAAQVKFLKEQGFAIEENVADTVTGYVATFGSGKPVIAFLGEFDALYGLSQMADVTEPKPDPACGDMGQGCGHHLLGVGSIAAGIYFKDYLEKTGKSGTIKIYGCPAEEKGSSKAYFARDGYFKGCDIALSWHPSLYHQVCSGSSQSCIGCYFRFHGVAAHAAGEPELGRSALDACELMNVGVNYLREHMEDAARIHYAYSNPGTKSPNVVHSEAEILYFIRSATNPQCLKLFERVKDVARGAALMTGTTLEIIFDEGLSNTIPNYVLEDVMDAAFRKVGVPEYTAEDRAYAAKFKATFDVENVLAAMPQGIKDKDRLKKNIRESELCDYYVEVEHFDRCTMGSTDVGDVSWVLPTAQINTNCYSYGAGSHSWQWVAMGKSDIAMKGMLKAGEVMAEAAKMLVEDPSLIQKAWEEFDKRMDGLVYPCLIPQEIKPHIYE